MILHAIRMGILTILKSERRSSSVKDLKDYLLLPRKSCESP